MSETLHAAHPWAPLLCTSGQPSAAAVLLLQQLPAQTTAHLSCDLDMGGSRIAAHLMRSWALRWQGWRMDALSSQQTAARGAVILNGEVMPYHDLFPSLVEALQADG